MPKRSLRGLSTAINFAMARLIEKEKKEGLWENFGRDEVGRLKELYIDDSSYSHEMNVARDKIRAFSDWCASYTGTQGRY